MSDGGSRRTHASAIGFDARNVTTPCHTREIRMRASVASLLMALASVACGGSEHGQPVGGDASQQDTCPAPGPLGCAPRWALVTNASSSVTMSCGVLTMTGNGALDEHLSSSNDHLELVQTVTDPAASWELELDVASVAVSLDNDTAGMFVDDDTFSVTPHGTGYALGCWNAGTKTTEVTLTSDATVELVSKYTPTGPLTFYAYTSEKPFTCDLGGRHPSKVGIFVSSHGGRVVARFTHFGVADDRAMGVFDDPFACDDVAR